MVTRALDWKNQNGSHTWGLECGDETLGLPGPVVWIQIPGPSIPRSVDLDRLPNGSVLLQNTGYPCTSYIWKFRGRAESG